VIVATQHAPTQRRFLAQLVRSAETDPKNPDDRCFAPDPDFDPAAALALARREQIAALLHADGIEDPIASALPHEFRAGCEAVYLRTLIGNINASKAGRRILGAMQCHGITAAPVDAWSVSQTPLRYYDDPGARPIDEIEIVVRESDRGRAESLLFELGYRRTRDSLGEEHDVESSIFRPGECGSERPVRLRWGWEGFASRTRRIALTGGDFLDGLCDTTVSGAHRPTRVGDLLVASIRAARPGAGRWISLADIHRIVTVGTVDWREITHSARHWRLRAPLYASLVAARELFGTRIPREALAGLSPGPIRRHLLARSLAACRNRAATARMRYAAGALLGESWWDIARGAVRTRGSDHRRIGVGDAPA